MRKVVASMALTSRTDWDERLSPGRGNSFDVIRLTLALLVVLAHSFFLIDGRINRDPLFILTHGQSNCGAIAVYFFFAISGFLVTRSWLSDPNLLRYMSRRVARIVPGFLIATVFGFLLVGPLASASMRQYFLAQNWFAVVVQTVALKQAAVTGAFTQNKLGLVHGTLFTIRYEFDCYIVIAVLGLAGLLRYWPKTTFVAITVSLIGITVFRDRLPVIDAGWAALLISSPHLWPDLLPFFFCGSALYVFRHYITKNPVLFWLSVAALILSAVFGKFYLVCLFCGTYAVLFLALSTESSIKLAGNKVDLSYGIYLYGWPIQQLLLFYLSAWMTPLVLFLAAMVPTGVVARMSWHFVEAPCLLLVRNKKTERIALLELESSSGPPAAQELASSR